MRLGAVLGGVIQGYQQEQKAQREQAQWELEQQDRARQSQARDEIAKTMPTVGDVNGTAPTTPSISAQEYQQQYGPANAAPGDIPTFQTPQDANKWAKGVSANYVPPAPPPPPAAAPAAGSATAPTAPVSGLPMTAPAPAAAPTAAGTPSLDPHALWHDFISPQEGGYSAHDGNGAPVNHGINQAANPGVDVKNLTDQQAGDIFATKYYAPSGAANMPPALAAVHADTYFMNPAVANHLLQQSGGDANKYMNLRETWIDRIENNPKNERFRQAWDGRNNALRSYMGNLQTNGAPAPADQSAASAAGPVGLGANDQQASPSAPAYGSPKPSTTPNPNDYVAYKASDGSIRFTPNPTRVTQDDADNHVVAILMHHGQYEQASALQSQIVARQAARQGIQSGQLDLEQKQTLAALGKAIKTAQFFLMCQTSITALEDIFSQHKDGLMHEEVFARNCALHRARGGVDLGPRRA